MRSAPISSIALKAIDSSEKYTVLVCLSDKYDYRVTLNSSEIDFVSRDKGIIEITLNGCVKSGELEIKTK